MLMNYRQQELQVYPPIFLNLSEWTPLPVSAHQEPILGSKSDREYSGLVFDRDRDRDRSFKFGIRL
jgi:hypothetical protein